MSVAIVIPARYASSRFPGKPLAPLRGVDGQVKTLIARSWEAACAVAGVDHVVVATDDARIADEARRIGADVAMTSPEAANGTERTAEAAAQMSPAPDIVVNLQGDAPLTPPWFVEALIAELQARPEVQAATPALRCDNRALQSFREDRRAGRVGATTAVFDQQGRALYFSKEVIPYTDGRTFQEGECPVFHHVGVYAYRPTALASYVEMTSGPLEGLEGLEQLRFMENGLAVHCVEVSARGATFWELNNPEDTPRVEAALAERGIA